MLTMSNGNLLNILMAEYVMPLYIDVYLTSGFWIWVFCLVSLEYTEKLVLKYEELQITNIANDKIQSGPKKCIHSLLINIFGINLNEISISGWECNIMFSQQMAQALL